MGRTAFQDSHSPGHHLPPHRVVVPVAGDPRGGGSAFNAHVERGKSLEVATYDRRWAEQSTLQLVQPVGV